MFWAFMSQQMIPEVHGFETRWGECYLSVYLILPATLGHGVYSASNRKEYEKQKKVIFLGSKATASV
jgi:hypothetical protein